VSDAATMSLLRPRPSGLLPFVLASVVAHVLVVFVGLTVTWALSGPKVNLEPVPIKASLVRRGKPRDEKLLPTKPAEPVAEKPPAEAVKLPSKDAVKVPAKDPKADQANQPNKADPRKSLFDAINKTARPVRELEGEEDGDPDGTSDKQEGERYFGLLESVIRKNYDVSSTIPESERRALRAQVTLWLGPAGQVLEVTVTRPSGNDQFDSAVLLAIKKASPFTPPPQHLRDILKKDGVGFVFRP
jgi:TonB family protein